MAERSLGLGIAGLVGLAAPNLVAEGHEEPPPVHMHDDGLFIHLPGGISLSPHAHLRGTFGSSTASGDDIGALGLGGHDPDEENFYLQGLEVGASLQLEKYVEGFFTTNIFLDGDDDFDYEVEEAFLKLTDLPMGLEFRGGRFLNRLGFHNATHLHSWDFVDQNLPHARFLGGEGLVTEGGEMSLYVPGLPTGITAVFSASYGSAPSHDDHGHGHGGEDEHHDDEDEHHDEDEDEHHDDEDEHHDEDEGEHHDEEDEHHDDEDEHGHEDEHGGELEGEFLTANMLLEYAHTDFHVYRFTAGAVVPEEDGIGETYLAGLQYQWRENGYEAGGRALRFSTEAFLHDGEEDDHFGITNALVYTAIERLDLGLRVDYVEGDAHDDEGFAALALEGERLRYSGAITYRPFEAYSGNTHIRLQYNYDELDGGAEEEHSVWLQFGFDWGSGEVR